MRYVWGAISLIAFVVAISGLALIASSDDFNSRILGGVLAFIGLLAAYFSNRIGRRYKTA